MDELIQAARQAQAAYDWEKAIGLYSRALEQGHLPPNRTALARQGRAEGYRMLGNFLAEQADLEALVDLATVLRDIPLLTETYAQQATALRELGSLTVAQERADMALRLGRQSGDARLEAVGLRAVGRVHESFGNLPAFRQASEQAVTLFRSVGDNTGEALSLADTAWYGVISGHPEGVQMLLEQSLALFRQLGDRMGEAFALNILGISTSDAARQRGYYEQALEIYKSTGARARMAIIANNLVFTYLNLGLYARAREYAERALQSAREMQANWSIATYLDGLARSFLGLGFLDLAEQSFSTGLTLCQEAGDRRIEAFHLLGLGWVALQRRQPEEARQSFQAAVDLFRQAGAQGDQATALAWLGSACLALDRPQEGLEFTTQATALQEEEAVFSFDNMVQDVWWWHSQALQAVQAQSLQSNHDLDGAAWSALEHACQIMLASITSVSDEGLRRNYLNKVAINRAIVLSWSAQATQRGLPLTPLTGRMVPPGDIRQQLERMLDIGVRLSGQRDPNKLPRFIMEQFVELSGAERALLLLSDEQSGGRLVLALTNGLPAAEAAQVQAQARQPLNQASLSLGAVLADELVETSDDRLPDLEQRSAMAVPLVSQGRLLGVLYGDLRKLFGSFTRDDLNLLSVLANQAAAALENAQWSRTLEGKVEQRTAELRQAIEQLAASNELLTWTNSQLKQRNAELAIINSVSQGLVQQLDFQAIIDLIGDQLHQIFDAQVVYIALRRATDFNYVDFPYYLDRGQRLQVEPVMLGEGLTSHVIQSRQPLMLGSKESQMVYNGIFDNDEASESYIGVPILTGEKVIGVISVQSYEKDAYSDSDMRLLSTLAASMGVALENARLFQETRRLLEETEQRATELATVNTISQALASELELDALIQLIGEQIRQAFTADIVYVALHDPQAGLIHFPYNYGQDGGTLRYGEGLTSRIIASGEPLLINQDIQGRAAQFGTTRIGKEAKSYLGVPILAGREPIGVISVQSTRQEGRFDENDLHLLSTVAANVGAAIQNARLYQETQRRAEEMAILADIGNDIAARHELEPVLERIARHAQKILKVRDIAIYLMETDGQTLRARVAMGQYTSEIMAATIHIGDGLTGHIAQSGSAEFINYPYLDPRVIHIAGTPAIDDEGIMIAPVISRDELIGVINVWRMHTEGLFTQADLNFLVSVARQAAIAIESARLYLETQRRANEMAALAEVGRDISATLDLPTVLERMARHARELLNSDTSAVYLVDASGQRLHTIVALGVEAEEINADFIQLGEGILGDLAQRGAAEVVNDVDHDSRGVHIPGTPHDMDEKLMAVPLLSGQRVSGLMVVWRSGASAHFTQADLNFLSGLALQAEIAIENARLFAEAGEARAAAEEANASKSAFLANVSHELRTPLTSILGFARIVLKRLEERIYPLLPSGDTRLQRAVEQVSSNMSIIIGEGQRLTTLINNVLDLEKIEAGKMTWNMQPLSMAEVIDQAAAATTTLFEQKGLQLILETEAQLPEITGDRDRLVQVVINLFSNAVKFTPQGTICCRMKRSGDEIMVSVTDQGIGISQKDLASVFEKFKQVGDTLTEKPQGSGLGLPICKEIVEHHGGRIWVESQLNVGSSFFFTLKLDGALPVEKAAGQAQIAGEVSGSGI